MEDRKALIRLASVLPVGSAERRTILAGLQKTGRQGDLYEDRLADMLPPNKVLGSKKVQVRLPKGAFVDVEVMLVGSVWDGNLEFSVGFVTEKYASFKAEEVIYKWKWPTHQEHPVKREVKREIDKAKSKFKAWKWPSSWNRHLKKLK